MRRKLLAGLICVGLAAATLWPASVHAQRRGVPRVGPPVRKVVVVRPRYYRPYYRPYFAGFYGAVFGQRYPYPYPHPYYGYRFDPRAEVRIDVEQRDAEVYVDGYFVGLVDDFDGFAQRLRLEPGDYEITIYHPAYRTWSEQVRLRPRQSLTIPPVLEPIAAGSQPDPRPEPSASAASPYGGRAREGRPGPPRSAAEHGALGTLSIRVQPADADVFIDGERWDWPAGENRLVVDLPEGSHRVEVRREGHQSFSTTVDVRRGEVTPLNVSLRRNDQSLVASR